MARTPTAAYSIYLDLSLDNVPGVLGRLAGAIGAAGGNIAALSGFEAKAERVHDDIVVNCRDVAHAEEIVEIAREVDGVTVEGWYDRTFHLHEGGKIEVLALCPVGDADDLSMAYTPGVARVCRAIADDEALSFDYTIRKNTVAIVTDGTAVLGLGNIGPTAALPVMEGKALLFKEFAGVDGFPICLDVESPQELIDTVVRIAPTFGGINLEDIAAPAAFEIEEALRERLDIPVFHDDQHGTAVVALAALRNSLRVVDKQMQDVRIVIAGMGAAGLAIGRILLNAGVGEIIGADRRGAIFAGREGLNPAKEWFADNTNADRREGSLSEILVDADVFIGVSGPDLITAAELRTMAPEPIVFAMANPDPEIRPEEAEGIAAVMATGRSDFPNQINNVLAFPGIFRGAFDAHAEQITENMKLAAATAIAESVSDLELSASHVIPSVFDTTVPPRVAAAVANAARADGVCR